MQIKRQPAATITILAVGMMFFAIGCTPLFGPNGRNPTPNDWLGFALVWPIPILISGFLDDRQSVERVNSINAYAAGVSLVYSAMQPAPTPGTLNPFLFLIGGCLLFPYIYLTSWLIERITQWLYSFVRELTNEEVATKPLLHPVFISVISASILAIAILPYSIGRFLDQRQTQRAIDLANEDWAAGAVLYQMQGRNEYRDKFIDVCYLYDPETGLELKPFVKKGLIFQQTYNDQIQKLLKQNGSPAYAYNNMPSPEQLLAFMDAEDASLITTFPQIVGGSRLELQPKDSTTSQAIDNLALTYDGDQISDHNSNDKIAVTVTPGYIWVRENNDHVELYSHTGKLLLWADRQILTSKDLTSRVPTSNTPVEQKQTSSSRPSISKDQNTDQKSESASQSPVN